MNACETSSGGALGVMSVVFLSNSGGLKMHWKPPLVVAIGVVLFFAAASAYGAEPDACSLLTSAQVSAVLGLSVGNGQHLPAKNPKVCG